MSQGSGNLLKDVPDYFNMKRISTTKRTSVAAPTRNGMRHVVAILDESDAETANEAVQLHSDKARTVLNPSSSAIDDFEYMNRNSVPGTGDWIRDDHLFRSWVQLDTPILYVTGNPGSGKSYLSANIINYLQTQFPQGIHHPSLVSVAYFFFKDNDPNKRTFQQALKNVAYQASRNDPVYAKYIASRCHSTNDVKSLQSIWQTLFKDFFLTENKVDSRLYVVLDGMDEAYEHERQLFHQLLQDLRKVSGPRLHFLMFGRPQVTAEIPEAFQSLVPVVHVNEHKNWADIWRYVKNSIRKSKVLSRASKSLQEEILDVLTKKAEGMFLWADMMMRELRQKSREASIRKSLSQAPRGTSEMFRHVLKGFSSVLRDEDPNDLNTMLEWVACATRPLTLEELDAVLRLRSPQEGGVLYLEGKLRKQFASFFVLKRADGMSTAHLQGRMGEVKSFGNDDDIPEEDGLEDTEHETSFDSNPATTAINFCHASLGNFFRDEGQCKVTAGEGYPVIGIDISQARIGILEYCLVLLCDKRRYWDMVGGPALISYAAECWFDHLKDASHLLTILGGKEKQTIGRLLVRMFLDEGVVETWCALQTYRFFTEENLRVIRQWFDFLLVSYESAPEERDSNDDCLDDEELAWIRSTSKKPAETFIPVLITIGKIWLRGDRANWDKPFCLAAIHAGTSLLRGTSVQTLPSCLPVQIIYDAAEWLQIKHTSYWHYILGKCLREYGWYDEAMIQYEKALDMDQNLWHTRCLMSNVHALRGEYYDAIDKGLITQKVLRGLLEEQADDDGYLQTELRREENNIALWYEKIGDDQNALRYYRTAYESSNCSYISVINIIRLLGTRGRDAAEEIMKSLKELDDTAPGSDLTRLTECIWKSPWIDTGFFRACANAAEETDELAWLRSAYEAAIHDARNSRKEVMAVVLEVCLADIFSRSDDTLEKGAYLREKIVSLATRGGDTDSWEINRCKDIVVRQFSRLCLQKALDAGPGSREAQYFIKKLENLCKQKAKITEDAPRIFTSNYSAVSLGRWHRLNGHDEEARACFQPYIKNTLMILSNDVPKNDMYGYNGLARVLVGAGDEDSAIAILQSVRPKRRHGVKKLGSDTLTKPDAIKRDGYDLALEMTNGRPEENGYFRTSRREKVVRQTTKQKVFDAMKRAFPDGDPADCSYVCDGPCGAWLQLWWYGNICKYCMADLCDDCLRLVKEGAPSARKVCNPKHAWMHVPPLAQPLEEGRILLRGKMIDFEDFKDGLRRKWNV